MRLTFLSHFIICLALAAASWFAHVNGVFATVWTNDQSMMTSVIGALFVGSAGWLGWLAWLADDRTQRQSVLLLPSADFGHLAERILPMLGLFGTAFGLSLQAKALAGGATSFAALATSLYCTACGVPKPCRHMAPDLLFHPVVPGRLSVSLPGSARSSAFRARLGGAPGWLEDPAGPGHLVSRPPICRHTLTRSSRS